MSWRCTSGCARHRPDPRRDQEVLLQVGVYAGVPVANQAFQIAQRVFAEIDATPAAGC